MLERDPLALTVVVAIGSTVPQLKTLADRHAAAFETALWPEGAPPGLTWTIVHEQQITALRRSTEKLLAHDMALAERRGTPWPGGSSIRKETAVRLQLADELIARAKSTHIESTIDAMLFDSGELSPPNGLAKLVELSATLLLAMSRRMAEGVPGIDPLVVARMLTRMLGELLLSLRGLVSMVGDKELGEMLELMTPLHEALKKAKDADPPGEEP